MVLRAFSMRPLSLESRARLNAMSSTRDSGCDAGSSSTRSVLQIPVKTTASSMVPAMTSPTPAAGRWVSAVPSAVLLSFVSSAVLFPSSSSASTSGTTFVDVKARH